MLIQEVLQKYKNIEIEILLAHVLKRPKEFLYLRGEYKLTPKQKSRLTRAVQRRLKGEPVAYILGYKDFINLRFKVNKYTLIPRPETEVLVMKTLGAASKMHEGKQKFRILDVGTGSGCIAISLASQLPAAAYELHASDVQESALKVAKENAKKHKVKIKFVKSNLLKKVKGKFDIIVANLPYGWRGVKNRFSFVKDGLKYEPQEALYTQENGLMLIRQLLEQVKQTSALNPKSYIFLEFDPRQKSELAILIKKTLPEGKVKFYKDFRKYWRVAEIFLP